MFVLSFVLIALLILRPGNASGVIKNTDISGILKDTDIAYYMEHQLNGLPFNETQIDLYDIEDFIKTDAVTNEIVGVINRYSRALTNRNLDYFLTAYEIFEISSNLGPEFYDLFGHHMTETDYRLFAAVLDDILDFGGLSAGDIIDELNIGTVIPYLILTSYLLWGVILLFAAAIIVIYLRNREMYSNVFLIAGIPVLLSGLIYLTSGILLGSFPEVLGGRLYSYARVAAGAVNIIITLSIIFTALGVLSIVVYCILRRFGRGCKV